MIFFFFLTDPPPTEIYTLSLHDALPISVRPERPRLRHHPHGGSEPGFTSAPPYASRRESARGKSEEHTSELQSRGHLVCRLLLEKKKTKHTHLIHYTFNT